MRPVAKFIALLILLVAVSCAPAGLYSTQTAAAPDSTPTRETLPTIAPDYCDGVPGEGFTLVTRDTCLNGTPVQHPHGQSAPIHWTVANTLETGDGLSGSEFYTDYAPIELDAGGYRWVVEGRAGRWGFAQQVSLSGGCYIAKANGVVSIIEMSHFGPSNIGMRANIGTYHLEFQEFPAGRDVTLEGNLGWGVWAEYIPAGDYLFNMEVVARYATAMPGTEIVISMIALALDPTGGHCR